MFSIVISCLRRQVSRPHFQFPALVSKAVVALHFVCIYINLGGSCMCHSTPRASVGWQNTVRSLSTASPVLLPLCLLTPVHCCSWLNIITYVEYADRNLKIPDFRAVSVDFNDKSCVELGPARSHVDYGVLISTFDCHYHFEELTSRECR